jgi:DUF1680 family protein
MTRAPLAIDRPEAGNWSEDAGHVPRDHAPFREVPVSDVEPAGWLRHYLQQQLEGLTGHMEVAGYPFGVAGWAQPESHNRSKVIWEPYEQDGYWLDGMIRVGLLLGDERLLAKARSRIDRVIADADPESGYLGPMALRDPASDEQQWHYARRRRWAHAVFFRALSADADPSRTTRDHAQLLRRHYLGTDYCHHEQREVCNVESMLWAYRYTADPALLDLAVQSFEAFNTRHGEEPTSVESLLSDAAPCGHGVTYNEMSKLGALLYRATGEQRWLDASIHAYEKLDEHQMLVSGVVSSSEHLRGKDPLDSYETCDIADQTWSQGHLLLATGDAGYADAIERACFNAAPGAVTPDFKALQYFSCPNQVIATATSNHNTQFIGRQQMSYRPRPGTPCCPGNVHRIMPNFAARMWTRHADGGVAATLYGPSQFDTNVGLDGVGVRLTQETMYPFRDRIRIAVDPDRPVRFPLWLRLPGWCSEPTVSLGGHVVDVKPGERWVRIQRTWSPSDAVELTFPMRLKLTRWGDGGVALERGPLVYALPVPTLWRRDHDDERSSDDFPAWNATPDGPWNYALALDQEHLDQRVQVQCQTVGDDVWAGDSVPISLLVPARRVHGWTLDTATQVIDRNQGADDLKTKLEQREGSFTFTPPLPDPRGLEERLGELEHVRLVPFGCTRLRVCIFPQAPHTGQ